jgi:hypothetical protein
MTTETETVQIRAHQRVVKKLGDWTTARRFDVRASRGIVVLDLLLPELEPGEIEITLDIDHATVKLLVPGDAAIDDDELRRVGRGPHKDWTGTAAPAVAGSSSSAKCATPRCACTAEASPSCRYWHPERHADRCAKPIAREASIPPPEQERDDPMAEQTALSDSGREREAVSIALGALAQHLPRYQRSLGNYARELVEGESHNRYQAGRWR